MSRCVDCLCEMSDEEARLTYVCHACRSKGSPSSPVPRFAPIGKRWPRNMQTPSRLFPLAEVVEQMKSET